MLMYLYQQQYQERKSDKWEEFKMQMGENYLKETTFKEFNIDILKEALVYNVRRLEDKAEDQRENWYILVLIK